MTLVDPNASETIDEEQDPIKLLQQRAGRYNPLKKRLKDWVTFLGEVMIAEADREYTDLQLKIFKDRYAVGDEEKPHEAWARVAYALAETEDELREFYWLLQDFRYVPGGRILKAIGNPAKTTAMNCFVLPSPHDSIDGIFNSLRDWTHVQAMGGGVGINVSSLRPRGFAVGDGKEGHTSGAVNWSEPFAFVSHD